jgi:hypothetical protein
MVHDTRDRSPVSDSPSREKRSLSNTATDLGKD